MSHSSSHQKKGGGSRFEISDEADFPQRKLPRVEWNIKNLWNLNNKTANYTTVYNCKERETTTLQNKLMVTRG